MEAMASSGSQLQSKIPTKKKRDREKSSSPSLMSSSFRTSSRTLPAKHDKYVYVRLSNLQLKPEWYSFVVNGSGEEDEKRKRAPRGFDDRLPVLTPVDTKKISLTSSCAVVDSTIYCVGGKSQRLPGGLLDRVRRLDTSRPEQSWKKAPSMLEARCIPQVVSLNGKIYVMGGADNNDLETWGVVFHPESNMWVSLPSPSPKPTAFCLFATALHKDNKFIVGSTRDDFVYTYNVVSKCWERFDNKVNYLPLHFKPVAVGTTLFWFEECELRAYDLVRKSYSSESIKGLEKVLLLEKLDSSYANYNPVLLHIAESEFILICLEDLGNQNVTLMHCIKIYVSKYAVQGRIASLDAVVRSFQTYVINNRQNEILDAVLMCLGSSQSLDCGLQFQVKRDRRGPSSEEV